MGRTPPMNRCFSRLFNELSIGAVKRVESVLTELSNFGMANAPSCSLRSPVHSLNSIHFHTHGSDPRSLKEHLKLVKISRRRMITLVNIGEIHQCEPNCFKEILLQSNLYAAAASHYGNLNTLQHQLVYLFDNMRISLHSHRSRGTQDPQRTKSNRRMNMQNIPATMLSFIGKKGRNSLVFRFIPEARTWNRQHKSCPLARNARFAERDAGDSQDLRCKE